MTAAKHFDVIIIGGSYAGLSAALALGRSLRNVLIIDSGRPCNSQTPHSHNFLTQDGNTPAAIAETARRQVLRYPSIRSVDAVAVSGVKTADGYAISTDGNEVYSAKKIIFATGIIDKLPNIDGIANCWGISVIHCPYCHGYEVKNERTGLLANGNIAFEKAKMLSNWTSDLTIFTNGGSGLTDAQAAILSRMNILVNEAEIRCIEHTDGYISSLVFDDGVAFPLKALYAHVDFEQACDIPVKLGCEVDGSGRLVVDGFQKTNVDGIFVCGDNSNMMRSVSNAVAAGSLAGAMANRELTEERISNLLNAASA